MTNNISEKLKLLQIEINKAKYGHCLLIRLINCDSPYSICSTNIRYIPYSQLHYDAIILLLPRSCTKEIISDIAFNTYQALQLSVNLQLNANLNCKIASISFPEDAINANEIYKILTDMLIRHKDAGYYQEYNQNFHKYELNLSNTANAELNLLRQNLVNNTVRFAYQPVIDKKNSSVIYHECLLRFLNSSNDLVSPAAIIKDIESNGLINIINYQALAMAIQQLSSSTKINLAFNLSNCGMLDSNILKITENLLSKYNVAHRLIIEITETSINKNYEKAKLFIKTLRSLGCKFALDDFGAGATSFKQLKNYPLDYIKIDGSYIRDIIDNQISRHFVEAIVKIAKALGIKTIAEFVENAKIAQVLEDMEIDYMQGNFFAPASISNITELE